MDVRFREAADAGWSYLKGRLDAGERLDKTLFMEALKRSAPALRKQGVEQVRDDPRGGFLDGVMMYGHHKEFDDGEEPS